MYITPSHSHTHTLTQSTVDPASPTAFSLYYNVCTALDLLTFLLGVLPRPTLLAGFKILNKGFITCMTCGNTKVHTILYVLYILIFVDRYIHTVV